MTAQLNFGFGANGLRSVTTVPRPGRFVPNRASAPTITTNGTSESKPPRRKSGTWLVLTRWTASPENMPMPMPAAIASPNDLRRAASAAARAATR